MWEFLWDFDLISSKISIAAFSESDIEWCRDAGETTWSVGLTASESVERGSGKNHVNFSEDKEATAAELRITYTHKDQPE